MATLGALAALVDAEVHGNSERAVDGMADLHSAGPRHISFLTNARYHGAFYQTKAAGVLVAEILPNAPCTLLVCPDPYLAMAQVANFMHPPVVATAGIDPQAHVSQEAHFDSSACIGPGAVVERGARIGAFTVVQGGAFVGANARIGDHCHLHPSAKVLHDCKLGHRVILHAGAVVGSDGFGFAVNKRTGERHKIPQLGIVDIGDDVEVGANSTIDRATFGATIIGNGCKIDNLVQIAHNVVLGRHCVVVSQTGIAGSTVLGDRVVVGAQGGIVGHVKITDDVTLGARAGVPNDIDTPGVYSGSPVLPHRQWLRMIMAQPTVPDLKRRVRALEMHLHEDK